MISVAFDLIDDDQSGKISTGEFVEVLFRLLHPPTTCDILIMKKNLCRVVEAVTGAPAYDSAPTMKSFKPKSGQSRLSNQKRASQTGLGEKRKSQQTIGGASEDGAVTWGGGE